MEVEDRIKELLRCIFLTQEEEIDAEAWDLQFERVAEMLASGQDISTVLPAINHYLNNSPDCREELYATIAMLRAEAEFNENAPS
jgi:hypothetical protein